MLIRSWKLEKFKSFDIFFWFIFVLFYIIINKKYQVLLINYLSNHNISGIKTFYSENYSSNSSIIEDNFNIVEWWKVFDERNLEGEGGSVAWKPAVTLRSPLRGCDRNRDPRDLATWWACGNGIQYPLPLKENWSRSGEGIERVGMLIVATKFQANSKSHGL